MIKRVEIVIDPPRGLVDDYDHDYVTVTAECPNEKLLIWFMKHVQDHTACQYPIEDGTQDLNCLDVIPGTFIMCGEGGNYCSSTCRKRNDES